MSARRRPVGMLAGAALALAAAAGADDATYKYREDDGTVWFTDRPPSGADHDDYEFIGYHGRPPARSSCRGLTEADRQRRLARIDTPLRRLTDRYGADRLLIQAIVSVESCFDPKAVSRVGAQGLMQLMPRTARSLGVTNAFDVNQNLRGGIRYFRRMRARFDGDLRLALAAYNAGPGAVERHAGVPPYPQTRRYIERVLDRLASYRRALAQ